jgi:hypothetical protein
LDAMSDPFHDPLRQGEADISYESEPNLDITDHPTTADEHDATGFDDSGFGDELNSHLTTALVNHAGDDIQKTKHVDPSVYTSSSYLLSGTSWDSSSHLRHFEGSDQEFVPFSSQSTLPIDWDDLSLTMEKLPQSSHF